MLTRGAEIQRALIDFLTSYRETVLLSKVHMNDAETIRKIQNIPMMEVGLGMIQNKVFRLQIQELVRDNVK